MAILTTFFMIIVAIIVMIAVFLLIKMSMYQPRNHAVSLDAPIHIDPNTLQPVIPRHVRDELMQARLQAEQTPVLIEQIDEADAVLEQPSEQEHQNKKDVTAKDDHAIEVNSSEEKDTQTANTTNNSDAEHKATTTETLTPTEEQPVESPRRRRRGDNSADEPLKLNPDIEVKKVEAFQGESVLLTANLADQQRHEEQYVAEQQQQVMEFYMYLSDHEDSLVGERFLKILDRYGLRFGEMNYFHRYQEDEQGKLHHMFSLGKRTFEGKTESFDLNTLPSDRIHAVVFFLTLPHYDAVTGYDMMMTSMHRMARELKGRIFDSNRNQFTPQLEADLREAIKEYVEQNS